jgi:hypothetical protein
MGRKLWTSPMLPFFRGTDKVPASRSFQSLTEYLRSHVGYWMRFTGTTDANGRLVVTHNCGFKPSAVFVTHEYVTGSSAHDEGPFHIHSLDETTVDIHFLTKSGQDDASSDQAGYLLLMPETESS